MPPRGFDTPPLQRCANGQRAGLERFFENFQLILDLGFGFWVEGWTPPVGVVSVGVFI